MECDPPTEGEPAQSQTLYVNNLYEHTRKDGGLPRLQHSAGVARCNPNPDALLVRARPQS
jgi:hypothetical protein